MNYLKPGTIVTSENPIYTRHGIGTIQQVRGDQAKVEFRPTVFSTPPYITESRILNLNEFRVVKSPIDRLMDEEFEDTWRYDLRTTAAHLLICNREGQLSNARTDVLPHQISIAHKVVTSPRRRYLIADEVGLGKTIEAGMILYSLKQRGQARRVLIITPAGLTLQWQEEMEDKFGMKYAVYREDVDGALAFEIHDNLVASIDTLKLNRPLKGGKREGHKTLVLGARDWDVIIFDEAHKLSAKTWSPQKTEKTLNYRLAEDLSDRCTTLIQLTATPHQGDESKFQNLISLLYENVSFDEFPKDSEDEQVPFTDLILRNRKSKVTDAEGNPIFKGIEVHPIRVSLESEEKKFHKALEKYLREGYGYAEIDPGDTKHKAIGFVMTTFQKLAASSTRAIKQALTRRLENLQKNIENTKNEHETEYDARHQGEYDVREATSVKESFVELETQMLVKLIDLSVPKDAKHEELLQIIESVSRDDPNQLILIFTEYLATQDFLVELLEDSYGKGSTSTIRGGMTLWEKRLSMAKFRDNPEVRFLISTEAGGEGINLQFAHVMINYDLPWNPFRLAQRYGRLYRYGQDKVVQVFNLQNAGTIEERIRQYLEEKTNNASIRLKEITGETVEEIKEDLLGLFEEFLDYERIYRDGLAKGNIKPAQHEIDDGVKKAEKAYELAYTSLFSKDISPFNPERFKHEIQSPLNLEDVEWFVSEFVKRNGRNFSKASDGTWEFLLPQCLRNVKGLEKRYNRVTLNRQKAIRNSELEFMALGHPFTDSAIQHCGTVDFGGFAAKKTIKDSSFSGIKGLHCNFTVKLAKSTLEGESVSFEMFPVFVQDDGQINEKASEVALFNRSELSSTSSSGENMNYELLFNRAKEEVIKRYEESGIWEEDLFCLNAAVVEFV